MRLLKVTNVKQFMNKLLIENSFDSFLISEAIVKTSNSIVIDGHINREFFSENELSDLKAEAALEGRIFSEKMSRWSSLKPTVFSLMKGKKTPLFFKMSFCLADENIEKLLSSAETSIKSNDIDNLSVVVRFQEDELTVTSLASLKIFSLDKSLDKIFDDMVTKFLTSLDVEFEIM